MNADPELRERLERAAGSLHVDTERRLAQTHRAAATRNRSRRVQALVVAAAIGAVAILAAWQLRFSDAGGTVPAAGALAGRIAYVQVSPGGGGALRSVDLTSGAITDLYGGNGSPWGEWSPDGSRLAYVLEEPGPRYALIVANADGSDPATIVEAEDSGLVGPDFLNLSWSPDGTKIAYTGRAPGHGRTILVVNADGAGQATVFDGTWVWVAWSPDGQRLLAVGFPQEDGGRFDLYTMRPDGSDLLQLTDSQAGEHNPSWSPDGSQIAFAMGEGDYDQDVYVMNADGSDVRRITDRMGVDFLPTWSPDAGWIAFASDRDATWAQQQANRAGGKTWSGLSLYVMHPDGSGVVRLLDGGSGSVLPTAWAP